MRTFSSVIALLLAVGISAVAGQGPECAGLCQRVKVEEASSLAPACGPNDVSCYCGTSTFTSAYLVCIRDNCAQDDVAAAEQAGREWCENAAASSSVAASTASAASSRASSLASVSSSVQSSLDSVRSSVESSATSVASAASSSAASVISSAASAATASPTGAAHHVSAPMIFVGLGAIYALVV